MTCSLFQLIALCLFTIKLSTGNYFKQYEELIMKEDGRRAQSVLESDLLGGFDTPKEIEINCPQDPIVSIKDLIAGSDSYDSDECM